MTSQQISKSLGQLLLNVGMAGATVIIGNMLLLKNIETRLETVEHHLTTSHPSLDYRRFLDYRDKSINDKFNEHLKNHR